MQNNNSKLNTILLVCIIILVGIGIWKLGDKKEETNIQSEKNSINTPNQNQIDTAIFTSRTLGIQFTYPKEVTRIWGTPSNIHTEVTPVIVIESGNKLIVSVANDSEYALIYKKDPNETFEQAIVRELVKKEYQNNPCYTEKVSETAYKITFGGNVWPADGPWSTQALADFEKCGKTNIKFGVTADSVTGGFYLASRGTQDPSFGVDSSGWWPKGIKFIK